jgi:carbonic anhydrase
MTVTDQYLANNREYAETFNGPLPLPPAKNIAVVACMDARINVYAVLGLQEGESHVIRNAGGVVTDDDFKKSIQEEVGIKPEWAAEAFSDLDEDVRQSIARIKSNPFIVHKDSIRGFIFDVATGLLHEVEAQ